ncbi:MAG: dihydropteroate synthase [Candidatus Thermoplasmatota archaeon]|nr:dihydropteroate synthase [Candidatus Thermoplasmatota archaeon]
MISVRTLPFGFQAEGYRRETAGGDDCSLIITIGGEDLRQADAGGLAELLAYREHMTVRSLVAGEDVAVLKTSTSAIRSLSESRKERKELEILDRINRAVGNYLNGGIRVLKCESFTIDFSSARIMGILNVTPDSFSDGGQYFTTEKAVSRAVEIEQEGADVIDIGGESTRPGATPITASEEMNRVIPVIREVHSKVDIPISVDTYHPEVARAALDAGASIINDITGLRSPQMRRLVGRRECPYVIMHMRGNPADMQLNPVYEDVVYEILKFLSESIEKAESEGIDTSKAMVDPGLGFGKTFQHNVTILNRLDEFRSLGHPLLVGASRKSFIGHITQETGRRRLEGSLASAVCAMMKGASMLRVHDVKETAMAIAVARSIMSGRAPSRR